MQTLCKNEVESSSDRLENISAEEKIAGSMFMEKKKRIRKSRKASALFVRVFLLVFVCAVSVGIGKQAVRYQAVKEELAVVTAEIKEEQEKQLNFETRKEYYTGDVYIEQVAREQLGMVKPNEIIYINRSE
jgi:cell division protein FtsB